MFVKCGKWQPSGLLYPYLCRPSLIVNTLSSTELTQLTRRACFYKLVAVSTIFISMGVTDGHVLVDLEEGVGHAAADDHLVHLVDEVLDELDLVGDLGPAEDGEEGVLGRREDLLEVVQLLLHQEPCRALVESLAQHRAMMRVKNELSTFEYHGPWVMDIHICKTSRCPSSTNVLNKILMTNVVMFCWCSNL